jgi:signal peptidase I
MTKKPNPIAKFFGFDNLSSVALLIAVIFMFRELVVSPYHVPTASMEPTIKVGDRLLASKLSYGMKIPFVGTTIFEWARPKRGDIIVFKYPENPSIDYVKRVIAVAGEKVQLIDDIIHVDGVPQERRSVESDRAILDDIKDDGDNKDLFKEKLGNEEHWVIQIKSPLRHFARPNWPLNSDAYVVPADSVFVMGDNRDNSTDSRAWGEVPISYVRGQALLVLWSAYQPDEQIWYDYRIRFSRFGHLLQ